MSKGMELKLIGQEKCTLDLWQEAKLISVLTEWHGQKFCISNIFL